MEIKMGVLKILIYNFKVFLMQLSKYNLKNIQAEKVLLPHQLLFDLPEKVLQFGTGVLLRGPARLFY